MTVGIELGRTGVSRDFLFEILVGEGLLGVDSGGCIIGVVGEKGYSGGFSLCCLGSMVAWNLRSLRVAIDK